MGDKLSTKLIHAYLCKQLLMSVFLVIIIAASLFFVVSIILWSPEMTASGLNEKQIFLNVFCKIPWFLSNIYPAVIAVGALTSFSILSSHNELVVLRAAGLSSFNFAKIIFLPTLLLALVGFFLIAYLGPMGYALGEQIAGHSDTDHSIWLKEKNKFIYIQKMTHGELDHIRIFKINNSGVEKFYTAKTADASKLYSVLINNYKKNAVTQKAERELPWPHLPINLETTKLLTIPGVKLDLPERYHLIKIQKKMGLNSRNTQFQLWRIILLPFFTVMLVFSIMPFAFHDNRSNNLINSAFLGLAISLIFYFLNQIAWPMAVVFNLPVFVGALIAPAVIFIICFLCTR